MDNTLEVTSALSDPTRYSIYQHIIKTNDSVTVGEVSAIFDIHPNVARLHLSKLENVQLITSYTQKTGKGGRPGRLYCLSDNVVELSFPYRDYKLLASIAMETFVKLGKPGKALYDTGKQYGAQMMAQYQTGTSLYDLSKEDKFKIIKEASTLFGMYPQFQFDDVNNQITMAISNCPFKEVAAQTENQTMVCTMHQLFLKGMFEELFEQVELIELNNMLDGCKNCLYAVRF